MPVNEAPAPDADLAFPSAPDFVAPPRRRRPPRKRPWVRVAVLAGLVAAGAGLAAWAGVWIHHILKTEETNVAAPAVSQFNCQFKVPGPPWRKDESLVGRLHVNLGLSRQKPRDHMGLFLKDYKTRMPTEGELMDEALGKLRGYLTSFEWEKKPKDDAMTLGGKPAVRLEFVGADAEQVPVAGECWIVAWRGYAYWFYTWAPEENKDEVARDWEGLRKGFTLLGGREGWKEQPPVTTVYTGARGNFRLSARDLWKKKNVEDYGEMTDLVLEAYELDRGTKPHAGKTALFFAFVLPKADSLQAAVAAARAQLAKRMEDEGHAKVTYEAIKEKGGAEADRDTDLGALRGHLTKLQVLGPDDGFERYMVLGVAQRAEGTLMLLGDCEWSRRDFWEPEFAAILASLKAR
jgi:hypothetical protein